MEIEYRHKERMAALDKGLDLPPEPIAPARLPAARSRYLLHGLIWLGVGFAVVFGVRDWLGTHIGQFGWIAIAIGAANLIYYAVQQREPST